MIKKIAGWFEKADKNDIFYYMNKCLNCKHDLKPGKKFCTNCGTQVPIPTELHNKYWNEPSNDISKKPEPNSIIPFGGYNWRVLEVQNDRMLILSDIIIEKREYHNADGHTKWGTCALRDYLNWAFYNKFNGPDRALITEINNDPQHSNTTNDKIFLLSIEEVVKYFGDSGQLNKKNTTKINDQYNSARIAKDKDGKASFWWLRSGGYYGLFGLTNVSSVGIDGILYVNKHTSRNTTGGVRPALWLKL